MKPSTWIRNGHTSSWQPPVVLSSVLGAVSSLKLSKHCRQREHMANGKQPAKSDPSTPYEAVAMHQLGP